MGRETQAEAERSGRPRPGKGRAGTVAARDHLPSEREERATTLYLMCGLPGSGKTTTAGKLCQAGPALMLSPDAWLALLMEDPADVDEMERLRPRLEDLQWRVAEAALRLGVSVVLDYGFWYRADRQDYLARAEALGVRTELYLCDAGQDELWRRLEARRARGESKLPVTRAQLDAWRPRFEPPRAGELARYASWHLVS